MMIDSYSFGNITINGQKFTKDLIIFPEKINSSWRRKIGHLLIEDDIAEILDYKPEVLIIGTGASGLKRGIRLDKILIIAKLFHQDL